MTEAAQPTQAAPAVVTSVDSTRIAFERLGSGPSLILIGGALNDRRTGLPLANLLKSDFTVYTFDRRGRGDSSNNLPYGVEREIEDLAALIKEAGGTASVYGHSSGAFLGLLSAGAGLPIVRLATYEPPYAVDQAGDEHNTKMTVRIEHLVGQGKLEEALIFFMGTTGMPQAMIDQQRQAPHWPFLVAKAPTLAYELRLKTARGNAYVPSKALAEVKVPVRAMAGGASPDWMRVASRLVAESVQFGRYLELPGQNHMVAPEVIAPVLLSFLQQ